MNVFGDVLLLLVGAAVGAAISCWLVGRWYQTRLSSARRWERYWRKLCVELHAQQVLEQILKERRARQKRIEDLSLMERPEDWWRHMDDARRED